MTNNTLLTIDEQRMLIPPLTSKTELNDWEQRNITEGAQWVFSSAVLKRFDPFQLKDLKRLHKKMFSHTWRWAGMLRSTEKNIGVPVYSLHEEIKKMIDDALYWAEHEVFPAAELAVRYHHKLVFIHLFPNGNGRHARLIANTIMLKNKLPQLSWGSKTYKDEVKARNDYISALKKADQDDFNDLIAFAEN